MRLKNKRFSSGVESTLGLLSVDSRFFCYVLEDQFNEPKIPGETRIPAGRYEIILRTSGGMHARYLQRFSWHIGMLWLQDVPGFEWVYIHVGNKDDHTEGCLLVGDGQQSNVDDRGQVMSSAAAYKRLYFQIIDALTGGDRVYITVEDHA